mmetsp:Transcript_21692/g.44446  ORF Transcript_21692/g.44446 Transcript_21692/m.44446 type:complete len:207 (-) Transcript_21692:12-632(-)
MALDDIADLEKGRRGGRVRPALLDELHLGEDLDGLGKRSRSLLHVRLLSQEFCALLLTQGCGRGERFLVFGDIPLEAGDLRLQLSLLGRSLLNEGGELLDSPLRSLDRRGLLLLVGLAPALVLAEGGLVLIRILFALSLHLLDKRDHLPDGTHVGGDRGGAHDGCGGAAAGEGQEKEREHHGSGHGRRLRWVGLGKDPRSVKDFSR